MAMAILDGLPSQFESLITILNALEDDESLFTLKLVNSRLLRRAKEGDP